MSSITFNQIPSNLRVPFVLAEISNSAAIQGPAVLNFRALIIGQKLSGGAGLADHIYRVTSEQQVVTLAGRGSLLHRMARAWFRNNGSGVETWIGVLADSGSGVAAAGGIAVTGPATGPGVIALYIGGERVPVSVASGASASTIAAAIDAAINANADFPITSSVSGANVTLTARHAGVVGNEVDVRLNYNDGEALPAGVGIAITAMTGGATNPLLANLIAALGDTWFHIIANPYKDATSLTALEAELADRFGPIRMIDGMAFAAQSDTFANLTTLGNSRNSPHLSIPGVRNAPRPAFETATRIAAIAAYYGQQDQSRQLTSLAVTDELQPAETDKLTLNERNQLLYGGISTLRNMDGGVVEIDRLITTYKTNSVGAQDESYLDVTTMLNLMYLRYSFRTRIASKYPRHKLANDSDNVGAGQAVMTPKIGRGEALSWFREMQGRLMVDPSEDAYNAFDQNLIVERDDTNPNRLNFLLPPDLINNLLQTGVQIQFRLSA